MGITRTSGSVTITTSGALISSGKPVRVYSCTHASGGTAGVVQLYNGTAASGTPKVSLTGTASRTLTQNFENGLLFPSGCYVELVNANCSAAVLECCLEL